MLRRAFLKAVTAVATAAMVPLRAIPAFKNWNPVEYRYVRDAATAHAVAAERLARWKKSRG